MLYCIIGESGSGKNTLMEKLLEMDSNLCRVVTATTRPIRPGEIPGRDYHFIDEELAKKMLSSAIEARKYKVESGKYWYYLTPDCCLSEDNIRKSNYICVAAPEQFSAYFEAFPGYVIPIILKVSEENRLIRALMREANPDCKEICRRFLDDTEKYIFGDVLPYFIFNNDGDNLDKLADRVLSCIYDLQNVSAGFCLEDESISLENLMKGLIFGSLVDSDIYIPDTIIKDKK